MELEIVKEIPDQDFGFIELSDDEKSVEVIDHHGTIYLVKGLCDEPDGVPPIGVIDGENEGRIAVWKTNEEVERILKGETK